MERHGWMSGYGVQSVERKRGGDETNELQRIAIINDQRWLGGTQRSDTLFPLPIQVRFLAGRFRYDERPG
jgi:hypothetical protein